MTISAAAAAAAAGLDVISDRSADNGNSYRLSGLIRMTGRPLRTSLRDVTSGYF